MSPTDCVASDCRPTLSGAGSWRPSTWSRSAMPRESLSASRGRSRAASSSGWRSRVRSSDLSLDPALEQGMATSLKGVLEESLFLGAHYRHYVRVGDLVLLVDGPAPAKPGAVEIRVPVRRLRVFPPS